VEEPLAVDKRWDLRRRGYRPPGARERAGRQCQMQADIGFGMLPRKGGDAVEVTARHHSAAGIDAPAHLACEEGFIHAFGKSKIIGMHDKQSRIGAVSQLLGKGRAHRARFNKSHTGAPQTDSP